MTIDDNEVPLSPIIATKLVAVEGKDELRLLGALKDSLGVDNIEIRELGGKYSFRTKLKALRKTRGFSTVVSLGIMRDANSDASATFQSVCDALKDVRLPVPIQPLTPASGDRDEPQVIVLILPHGASEGMLEDICLQSVADDPAMPCVEGYFECLANELGKLPGSLSKAKLHAFLSSRDQPDLRLGNAAEAGHWPWTHQAFDQVREFLSLL